MENDGFKYTLMWYVRMNMVSHTALALYDPFGWNYRMSSFHHPFNQEVICESA